MQFKVWFATPYQQRMPGTAHAQGTCTCLPSRSHYNPIRSFQAFKTSCSNLLLRLESVPTKELKQVEVKKKKTKKSNSAKREGGKDNLWMYRNPRDWKAKASELARLRLAKMNKKKAAEAAVDRVRINRKKKTRTESLE